MYAHVSVCAARPACSQTNLTVPCGLGGAPALSLPVSCASAISSHEGEDWESCVCTPASPYGALTTGVSLGDFTAGFSLLKKILIAVNSSALIIF